MKISKTVLASLAVAATLGACGGGGSENGGRESAPYSISLRAEKTQLPVNVNNQGAGVGVYAPFSTNVYVEVSTGGRPAPSSNVGCHVAAAAGSVLSGGLFYPDKLDERLRSISLTTNSGGDFFVFHALGQAGTTRITCSVQDPRDGMQRSASVDIVVGAATGMPSHIRVVPQGGGNAYLGTRGNTDRIATAQVMQVQVLDDANQPISSRAGERSVQVRIVPNTEAGKGARLVAGSGSSPTSSVLQLSTVQNVANFSVLSGAKPGAIFLEYVVDRYDNNVANGIQDPIVVMERVEVFDWQYEAERDLPRLADRDLGEIYRDVRYSYFMEVAGGLPPYTWSATGLPQGLSMDANSGMITGMPRDVPKDYRATVTVTDRNGNSHSAQLRMRLVATIAPEDFDFGNCNLNRVSGVCDLGRVAEGEPFVYALSTSISGRDQTVEWGLEGKPEWLSISQNTGVLSGTAKCTANGAISGSSTYRFFITAKRSVPNAIETATVMREVSVTVAPCKGP